eukprot:m.56080 g.56080  ORF g.56080 m.56080 type:complete len:696 (+) comp11171_c0_seq4:53-2140(+)
MAKFWKPGDKAPTSSVERGDGGVALVHNPFKRYSMSQQRARLPVYKHREEILFLLDSYQTVVIVGETGSGKSTQIPQYLYEAGWCNAGKSVACLQPRRVAATSVAQRVAEERGETVGQTVGYCVRFDNSTSSDTTCIKYMTEGVLIREMMRDPLLEQYCVIMLDEAHERTMFMDVALGLVKKVMKRRKDLKVIVSSATLDAMKFQEFFNTNHTGDKEKDTAAILTVEGRMYPVEVLYAKDSVPDYVASTIDTILTIHSTKRDGDILAFLTGQDEVERAVKELTESLKQSKRMRALVLPLYGSLSSRDQMKVFDVPPDKTRKIVIATNIAETSITIPGVVFVVDCGFVKMKGYNAQEGIETLVVTPISKAAANQRAGRAGRMRSGVVHRLYTETGYNELDDATIPEMQRTEVSPMILQLKALGVSNVVRFPFMSPPPVKSMTNALEMLFALEALDDSCNLTEPLGLQMAEFPLPPMQAKMLLSSGFLGCSEEMVIIVAMLQVQHVFVSPRRHKRDAARRKLQFACVEGDLLTLLNVYNNFISHNRNSGWCGSHFINYKSLVRAREIVRQLRLTLRRFGVSLLSAEGDVEVILKCIVAGQFANAARLHMDGTYRTLRGESALAIHPSSVLYTEDPPPYVVYNDVILTSNNYMRDITAVDPSWLADLAPHFYEFTPKMKESVVTEKRPKLSELFQREK